MAADTTMSFLQSLQFYPDNLQQSWPPAPGVSELADRMQGLLMRKDGSVARLPVTDQLYLKLVMTEPGLEELLQPLSQCGADALSVVVSAVLQDTMSPPSDEIVLAGKYSL